MQNIHYREIGDSTDGVEVSHSGLRKLVDRKAIDPTRFECRHSDSGKWVLVSTFLEAGVDFHRWESALESGVTVRCPECGGTFVLPSLGAHSNVVDGPYLTDVEKDSAFLAASTGRRVISVLSSGFGGTTRRVVREIDKDTVTCHRCQAAIPLSRIVELSGELLFQCAFCHHSMLTKSLDVDQVVVCEKCGHGCTAGALERLRGTVFGERGDRDMIGTKLAKRMSDPSSEILTIRVSIGCDQESYIQEFGAAVGNKVDSRSVRRKRSVVLEDVPVGATQESLACPFCNTVLTCSVNSVGEQQRLISRRMAIAWVWVGLIIAFVIIGVLGANKAMDKDAVPWLMLVVALPSVALAGYSPFLFRKIRERHVDPHYRATVVGKRDWVHTWRVSGASTVSAMWRCDHAVISE